MKKSGIMNPEIAEIVTELGHGDKLAITDRGFPFPKSDNQKVVDVSVGRGVPGAPEVLEIVLEELKIEEVIVADKTVEENEEIYTRFMKKIEEKEAEDVKVTQIPHESFKEMIVEGAGEGSDIRGMIRTGQVIPYSNIILVAGVSF